MSKWLRISVFLPILSYPFSSQAQWELLHSDTNTVNVAVHFFDEENGILCGNREFENEADGFIAKTIDSGLSWDTVYWAERPLYNMHFPTENVGYACGFNTTVIKTTDGGQSWSDLNVSEDDEINWWHHLTAIHFINEDLGYVSKADGFNIFLKTDDGGDSWIIDPAITGTRDILFTTPLNGFMVGGSGGKITSDGGETWTSYFTGTENRSFISVYFDNTNESKGYLGGWGSQGVELFYNYACLARTLDGGENWQNRDIPEMEFIHDFHFTNSEIGNAVGTNFLGGYNFLKTEDGGETWGFQNYESLEPEFRSKIYDLDFVSDNTAYAVGWAGCIWKTTNAGGPINYEWPYSDIGELNIKEKIASAQIQVFPNPSQSTISIQSSDNISSIRLFDMLGKELLGQVSINSISAQINVSSLPVGMYQLEVDFGKEKLYRKILVE